MFILMEFPTLVEILGVPTLMGSVGGWVSVVDVTRENIWKSDRMGMYTDGQWITRVRMQVHFVDVFV